MNDEVPPLGAEVGNVDGRLLGWLEGCPVGWDDGCPVGLVGSLDG